MTKENLFKSFLEDSLLVEKNYITPEKVSRLKLAEPTTVKLLEVIKIAVNGTVDAEGESVTVRKINQYLNK